MRLSLVLVIVLVGCSAPKKRLAIPPGCIKKIEPIQGKPCEPQADGIHAICIFRITYSCVQYK